MEAKTSSKDNCDKCWMFWLSFIAHNKYHNFDMSRNITSIFQWRYPTNRYFNAHYEDILLKYFNEDILPIYFNEDLLLRYFHEDLLPCPAWSRGSLWCHTSLHPLFGWREGNHLNLHHQQTVILTIDHLRA